MSQQINLFNPLYQPKRQLFSALTMAQALALLALGCGAMVFHLNRQVAMLEQGSVAAGARHALTMQRMERLATGLAGRQKSKDIEVEIERLTAELDSARVVERVLAERGTGPAHSHAEVWRAFARQTMDGVWLTGLTLVGDEIEVQGRAQRPELVPQLVGRLSKEPALKGKSFSALAMKLVQPAAQAAPAGQAAQSAQAATAGVGPAVGAAPQRPQPAYIEFRLHSSGLNQERAAGAAALGGGK